MLSFVLCDDNSNVLDRLSKILDSIFIEHNLDAEISLISPNPHKILEYIQTNMPNVFILDIDLKSDISGLDLADKIRQLNKTCYIIFTSAHLEYILLAYKYKTFDFIPKPITYERIEETILRLIDDVSSSTTKNNFIRLNHKNTIINQDSINFIKKDGMKLVFYTDTRTYETYNSFNKISTELPSNFVRCHKSYIANIDKISDINSNNNLIIFNSKHGKNDFKCNIGPKYKNNFMEVLKNHGNFSNNLDSVNNTK